MALTAYTIGNLIQGVSQQSDGQRDPTQGEIQVNGYSSLVDGLRKRAGTTVIRRITSEPLGDVFFHSILRDSGEKYLVVIAKTAVRVFDLNGIEKTVSAPSGYSYLSTVVSCAADIRCASIADFTFISSIRRAPAMSTSLAPATPRPAANEALVWIKAANYGQTYRVSVNGTLATVTTPVQPVTTSGTTITENRISTADIAEAIKTALAGVTGVTITREGSVLHLTSASTITVSATDARSNADITAIVSTVQAFTDLPTLAPRGYTVEIIGQETNQYDGFFVSFVPRGASATFGEGSWQECVGPGMPYQLDAGTMPQLLVRLPDGTFYFGPANGTTQGGVKLPSWGQRTAGDYDTAPDPSFIGKAIQDVFIYRNRLGLLADENVILSRVKDYFEFFPETVTTVLATDPIDLAASSNRVSVLRHAVPTQDELILFSDQLQFRLSSGDATLAPATAMVSILTAYEADMAVKPLQTASGIVFGQTNGTWEQFREFGIRGAGTALVGAAPSLTEHVPTYIPAGVTRLTGNDTAGVWFAITSATGAENRIYVYKFADRATGGGVERIQRSWSIWQLSGASKVLQILCVLETLYLLVEYPDGSVWLESMPVSDRLTTDALTTLLLDRQVTTTTATPAVVRVASGIYDVITKTTTWTLPFNVQSTTQAWSLYGTDQNGGKLLGSANYGNTITALGDWSNKAVVFGEPIEFRYRFSRFKVMQDLGGGRVASNVDRTQVRQAKIRYHDTSFFRVEVTPERRTTATYSFDGWQLGVRNSQLGSALGQGDEDVATALLMLETEWPLLTEDGVPIALENAITGQSLDLEDRQFFEGVFTIPIMARGESCIVELLNDTPNPCMFSSCDWLAQVTSRGQRM